jgi:threonylcarbamoyladenosine tRNA methylthiotransferase MtaB
MPHACIGVDVIVGFPGETDEDFLETYQFLNELDISYLHVFTYSERENTLAATMPEIVPGNKRADRSKMLHSLSEKKRRKFYEDNIGYTSNVLFENDVQDVMMHGFTDNYIRVEAKYDPILINEIMEVSLSAIGETGNMQVTEWVDQPVTHMTN